MAQRTSGKKAATKSKKTVSKPAGRTGSKSVVRGGSKTRSAVRPVRSKRPRAGKLAVLAVLAISSLLVVAVAWSCWDEGVSKVRSDGLPAYITDEMIETAQDMQKQYGHPAGCTLAQIMQESGQGTGLSALAEQDNNLFGMKWAASFEGKPGVVGPVDWGTNEEYDGATVPITGTFIRFESQKACIEFRSSVFLQASTYADNLTIRRAIETGNSALMAWGLQDAGWATDSSYAEHLIALMDQYDLYRFDA